MSRTTENETVEAAIDAVRKMIHDCPAIKGGLGEFEYQLKANGAIDRIESAHNREVAELREFAEFVEEWYCGCTCKTTNEEREDGCCKQCEFGEKLRKALEGAKNEGK